jgi:hypothetical protein
MSDGDGTDSSPRVSIVARGCLWLCLVLPDIKWYRYLRTSALGPLTRYLGYPWTWLPGAQVHAQLGHEGKFRLGRQVAKSCLPAVIETGKRIGADCSRVYFLLGWWSLIFSQEWWGHI